MMLLYVVLVVVLVLVRWLVRRRVARLEARYTRAADKANDLLRQTAVVKDGPSSRADPVLAAKRQYELGQAALKRDAVEARYARWQTRSEKLDRLLARLRGWKGRLLPYALGVCDVALALAALDWYAGRALSRTALAVFGG
jgi:hypothetical protein